MGLFGRKKSNATQDNPPKGAKPPKGGFFMPSSSIFGEQEAASLRGSEAIYAAVTRICNTVACMGLHLYKDQELAEDDQRERLVGYAPNANMTPYSFKVAMEACRNTSGTGYALIVPCSDMTTPERLDVLQPSRVQPLICTDTQELWYQFTLDDGTLATVHSTSIIALRHMSTDGVGGLSPIDVLCGTLKYDRKIKEISLRQLENVSGGVVLSIPTAVNDVKKKEYIESFLDAYRSSKGQLIVLEGGITATTLSGSVVDPKVLDTDSITKNKVATVYNIPPRMLGDTKASGYTTSEQDMTEYLKLTIMPIVRQWEEVFNRRMLSYSEYRSGYRFKFSIDELQRGDTAAMAEKHQKGVRGAKLTPNEARREDGLPPLPYGDELMASRDLMPLSLIVKHPELLLGKSIQNLTDNGEEGGNK